MPTDARAWLFDIGEAGQRLLIHGYAVVEDEVVRSAASEKLSVLLEDAESLLKALD